MRVERHGAVGWLVFDRPDRGNTIDEATSADLQTAWAALDADTDVGALVVAGDGVDFCRGVDGEASTEWYPTQLRHGLRLTSRQCEVRKPVVAAVQGRCGGLGLGFIADADLVVAATDATFAHPATRLGLTPGPELAVLARRIPLEATMRLVLSGGHLSLDAGRARQVGLVGEICEPSDLRARAQATAEALAANSPGALAATKRAVWGALETGLTEACQAGAQHLTSMWGHPDQTEGPQAFAERRSPTWEPLP